MKSVSTGSEQTAESGARGIHQPTTEEGLQPAKVTPPQEATVLSRHLGSGSRSIRSSRPALGRQRPTNTITSITPIAAATTTTTTKQEIPATCHRLRGHSLPPGGAKAALAMCCEATSLTGLRVSPKQGEMGLWILLSGKKRLLLLQRTCPQHSL